MRRSVALLSSVVLMLAITGVATADPPGGSLDLAITKAPIAPDGVTAGAPTDFVISFLDLNPNVDGLTLESGDTIEVVLPAEFIPGAGQNLGVLLQGWPQSPPAPPPSFLWTTTIVGNTVTLELTSDWAPGEFGGPGAKQVHLVLLGWTNPSPGSYPIELTVNSDETLHGVGRVHIIPNVNPSINAVSIFSGGGPPPPFNNAIYHSVDSGETTNPVGLYLWERGGGEFLGVDVSMKSPQHGTLVDSDGRAVGQVNIKAPKGADDYTLTTMGPSVLGTSFLTNLPVGILQFEFTTDADTTGRYQITFRLNNGNKQTIHVSAG